MKQATSAYRYFFVAMLVLPWLHACTSTPIGPAEARSSPSPAIPATSPSPPTLPPSDTPPTMTSTPLNLPAFIPGRCRFQPEEGIEVECGDLIVPEDHQNPGTGRSVSLHIAIFKSTSEHPERDPVIYLSGSANQLGAHAYYMEAGGDQILRTRDTIMYNQRGAEFNQPELDCPDYAGVVMEHSPRHCPFSKEVDDDLLKWFLQCQQGLETEGINLKAYNTYENAADAEDLRIALGYDQIYGTSYGTLPGLTVMRSNGCAQKMGLEFLDDPFSAPDAACMEQRSPPPFK